MTQDLLGRTALVTGGNSGVGLELTKALLARGAEVAALVRSDFPVADDQTARAKAEGRLRIYRADFTDFPALKAGLATIRSAEPKLDLLFNNAGVSHTELRWTSRRREAHFEINTVVPYIVLHEMAPLLAAGTLKTVVNTSSIVLKYIKAFSIDLLERPPKHIPIFGPYGVSKLALSLWTSQEAADWAANGIEIRSACPGTTKTKMTARPQSWLLRALMPVIAHSAAEGARRVLAAALGDRRGPVGSFLSGGKLVQPKFLDWAPAVTARVREIYEREFLPI